VAQLTTEFGKWQELYVKLVQPLKLAGN
jgi:hypothetical protein